MRDGVIDEIKSRLDVVKVVGEYIRLQKAGVNYRANCPFHQEKTPSFFVSPARQTWHCFGSCSEGGDIFKFVMKIEGIEFGDALRLLAQKAGVELKKEDPRVRSERERLYEICELATKFFQKQLESKVGQECLQYLEKRGLNSESVKKWRIGYAPEQGLVDFLVGQGYKRAEVDKAGLSVNGQDRFRGRIIFPVFNISSAVIGFGGRVRPGSNDQAKYINTPATILYDKSRTLYGLDQAKLDIRKKDYCLLVEGYTDVILLSQYGYTNVVSTSGTALTNHQLDILKRYSDNLYTAFDMDVAGNSATKRGIDLARSRSFNIKVVTMTPGLDPADMIQQQPEEWDKRIESARSVMDFYLEIAMSQHDIKTVDGKKKIAAIVLPEIKVIDNAIERDAWINRISDLLSVDVDSVRKEIEKVKIEVAEIVKEEKKEKHPRRLLLEKHLLLSAIRCPELLQEVNDFSSVSPLIRGWLEDIKNGQEILGDDFNALSLEADLMDGIDPRQEFKSCLSELNKLFLKDRLTKCHLSIKTMEENKNDEEARQVLKEFQSYYQGLQTGEDFPTGEN